MNKGRALLVQHLEQFGLSQKAFAEACGISPPMLCHLITGNRRPTLRVAFLIQHASEGDVPAESWLKHNGRGGR